MGWWISSSRRGARSSGTAGSRVLSSDQTPGVSLLHFFFFFAGSSRLPSVDPQCGREAFSPAPETQTPDVREVSPRRFEDRAEPGSANQEISRSLPSTETPSLFSLPNPPGFWSSVRLLGGGAGTAGAGADPKPGSSGRGGGARRPPPPQARPDRPAQGAPGGASVCGGAPVGCARRRADAWRSWEAEGPVLPRRRPFQPRWFPHGPQQPLSEARPRPAAATAAEPARPCGRLSGRCTGARSRVAAPAAAQIRTRLEARARPQDLALASLLGTRADAAPPDPSVRRSSGLFGEWLGRDAGPGAGDGRTRWIAGQCTDLGKRPCPDVLEEIVPPVSPRRIS